MDTEFIEKQCKNCDSCVFERNTDHRYYPYPKPDDFVPTYCGEITEDGGYGIPFVVLECCPKNK